MKILLISPSDSHVDGSLKGGVWHAPPLGLAYMATILENDDQDVGIYDMSVEETSLEDSLKFNPDIVGITCTTPTLKNALITAKKVDEILPESIVLLGGPHPSIFPQELVKNDFVDIVVVGESEITIKELISSIEDEKDLKDVNGILYKDNGKIIQTNERELIDDIDKLPFPARHLLKIYKYPNHPLAIKSPGTTILTSRGCPARCIFCNKSVFGRTFRVRSPKNVVDEIDFLVDKYKIKELQIIDDTFTLYKKRTIEICKEILERKIDIKWMTPNGIRAGTVDNETASWMKKSGCHFVFLGVESGNPEILKNIKKDITLAQVRDTVKILNENKIDCGAFFMIGLLGESPNEIIDTINFAKSLDLDAVKFGITVPLPGTELFDVLDKQGFIKNYNFDEYFWHKEPVFETDKLKKDQMFRLYKKAYRAVYLNPKYIFRKISKIRSIEDLKNNLRGLSTVIRNQLSGI